MEFSAHMAAMDDRIEDRLCDPAVYTDATGVGRGVRISIDHPRALDRLQGMSIVRGRPVLSVRRTACPHLSEGDKFQIILTGGALGEIWEVAEAPTAEDDGRWWAVEVMPG